MVIPTFFNTTLHAEPCVAPIPGENLWRLTSRIGTCLDILISQMEDCCSTLEACCHETISTIESTSDVLCTCVNTHTDSVADALEASICDCVDSAAASVADAVCSCVDHTLLSVSDVLTSLIDLAKCCPNLITSVPFTITTPGLYCLANSVSYAAGTAITIASDDVILDLQNNLMQRTVANTNAATTGAIVCDGTNCIIQNGLIDADNIIINQVDVIVRNIHIDNTLVESDITGGGINYQGSVIGVGFGSIENCSVRNKANAGILVQSNFVLVKDCQVYNCRNGIFMSTGGSQAQIIDCISSNNSLNGFLIDGVQAKVINCLAVDNANIGFFISSSNASINDCIASNNTFHGFAIEAADITVKESLSANNGDTGFLIVQQNAVIVNCISREHHTVGNLGCGFLIETGADGAKLSNNLAADNDFGYRINNIDAQATFSLGVPQNRTWSIGGPTSGPLLPTTTSRNIRLIYNEAMDNAIGYAMFGTLFDNGVIPAPPQPFGPITIFPPIGIVNSGDGGIVVDPLPVADTIISASGNNLDGAVVIGRITNAEGGNFDTGSAP
jgi:hypothetical protein